MENLPKIVNETAVRNERLYFYYLSLKNHTTLSYNERMKVLAEKFFIGERTVAKIVELMSREGEE